MDCTRRHSIGILLLIFAILTAYTRTASGQRRPLPSFAITDLGTLGGESSEAAAVNSFGDVAGRSTTSAGATHAFLHRNGEMVDLGTLPGGSASYATAINDRGDVAGYGGINGFGLGFREIVQGFIWQDGAMRAVGALYCPCTFNVRYGTSTAFALSNAGWVVGESQTNRQNFTGAFVWEAGGMHALDLGGSLAGDVRAFGINDSQEIVGDAAGRAFIARDGATRDLGVLPGFLTSSGRAVNRLAQVAGVSTSAAGITRAVLWDLSAVRDLGVLPGDASSEAHAINDAGDIVGRSGTADLSQSRAVIWRDGTPIDLTQLAAAPGWTLTAATGLNDIGQIVGVGVHDGRVRAFLLTPR